MSKIKRFKDYKGIKGNNVLGFYCPACKRFHIIYDDETALASRGKTLSAPIYLFNKDFDKPMVSPVVKVEWNEADGHHCCQSFLRGGKIQYLSGCTHEFAGKILDLEDIELHKDEL